MAKVTININPAQQILLKRKLNKDGQAQLFFTNEIARLSEPYVPFLGGDLKNKKTISENKITYNMPYASRHYYTNSGNGKEGNSSGGLRGKQWCMRMWIDRKKDIVKSVSAFVGGRAG